MKEEDSSSERHVGLGHYLCVRLLTWENGGKDGIIPDDVIFFVEDSRFCVINSPIYIYK